VVDRDGIGSLSACCNRAKLVDVPPRDGEKVKDAGERTGLGRMALALSIGLSACRPIAGQTDPQTQRGSVSLEGQQVEREGETVLSFTVPSCHGDPEVVDLEERPDRVLVEVVTTQVRSGDRMDCQDVVLIELERPLGDREVIDAVSGSSLDVARELHLECFNVPGSYARRDRGMGSVEFEVREAEEQYLIRGITQDADSGWGMTSLGGCWPSGP
jgi:hypothetical protein